VKASPPPNAPDSWEAQVAQIAGAAASRALAPELDRVIARATATLSRTVVAAPENVGSDDLAGFHLTPVVPQASMPLVVGLAEASPTVFYSADNISSLLLEGGILPWLEALERPSADVQAQEKAGVHPAKVSLAVATDHVQTYACWSDVAMQGLDPAGRVEEAVHRLLDSAACAKTEASWLAALDTAAGTASTSVADAVHDVAAGYGGPLVIVTPFATADLRASGYTVITSPSASATYVVATLGVSGVAVGPVRQKSTNPALVGRDLASAVFASPLRVAVGAVAKVNS
jgi:hypothetical protein